MDDPTEDPTEDPTDPSLKGFRSGYVALVGAPNVGKSTLMNRLLEERLAIVTPKPQTTRRRTLGILNGPGHQIILLDTPGLMEPRYDLHRAMLNEAKSAIDDADLLLCLVEPGALLEPPAMVAESSKPRFLAINKVDTVRPKEALLPVLTHYAATGLFDELFPISARDGTGVREMFDAMLLRLPEAPPFYPVDQLADQSERFFVGELIRERILERYREEVPYACEVDIVEFTERPGAKDYIEANVVVESPSQKAILIGAGAEAIRALGEEARVVVEEFLGRAVYLSLRVKVMPKWRKRAGALRRFGYRS